MHIHGNACSVLRISPPEGTSNTSPILASNRSESSDGPQATGHGDARTDDDDEHAATTTKQDHTTGKSSALGKYDRDNSSPAAVQRAPSNPYANSAAPIARRCLSRDLNRSPVLQQPRPTHPQTHLRYEYVSPTAFADMGCVVLFAVHCRKWMGMKHP